MELTVLNRGRTSARRLPENVRILNADIRDAASVAAAIGPREFDVVVDFLSFTPDHVRAHIERFASRTAQYVFISSASAYQKPVGRLPITESTPLRNPVWPYSQAKIRCEQLLTEAYRQDGSPVTIVRPSHTYDRTQVPVDAGWTAIDRMRRGKPVVVHGDGTSLWTLTHSDDVRHAKPPRTIESTPPRAAKLRSSEHSPEASDAPRRVAIAAVPFVRARHGRGCVAAGLTGQACQ